MPRPCNAPACRTPVLNLVQLESDASASANDLIDSLARRRYTGDRYRAVSAAPLLNRTILHAHVTPTTSSRARARDRARFLILRDPITRPKEIMDVEEFTVFRRHRARSLRFPTPIRISFAILFQPRSCERRERVGLRPISNEQSYPRNNVTSRARHMRSACGSININLIREAVFALERARTHTHSRTCE